MKKKYQKPAPEFIQVEINCPEVSLHPIATHFFWMNAVDENGVVHIDVSKQQLEGIARQLGGD